MNEGPNIEEAIRVACIMDTYKTLIQPTTAKLNTADSLSMTALGMTALHLR